MSPGDRVRLLEPFDDVGPGAEGIVLGFYRRPEGDAVAVSFRKTMLVVPAVALELLEPPSDR